MRFVAFIRKEFGGLEYRLAAVALLAGIANGLLVAVIIRAAGTTFRDPSELTNLLMFLLLLALFALSKRWVLDMTTATVERLVGRTRRAVADKIRRTELESFERVGQPIINSVLSQDMQILTESSNAIVGALTSAMLVIFSFAYIAALSLPTFYWVIILTAMGTVVFMRNDQIIQRELMEASAKEQRLFELLDHLLDGFRELKLNRAKSDDVYKNYLEVIVQETEALKTRTGRRFNVNSIFGESFIYVLVAVVIFIVPSFVGVSDLTILKIVAVTLFMIGPLGDVVQTFPHLAKADAAILRLERLEKLLEDAKPGIEVADELVPAAEFQSLACRGLRFTHMEDQGARGFTLGPIDLDIQRGTIVFLVGGNGSGKTTLLNLLCGLYRPHGGQLLLNDRPVPVNDTPVLRTYFSAILQDFHLFDRLYGLEDYDRQRARELLDVLDLGSVTGILPDGRFQTLSLSTGQRKRLALLVADLEDRPVIIFDEWAADQDPDSRRYFYREYLPSLRARGKTVIAATHDDHYFDAADKVLTLWEGKLEPGDDGTDGN